MFILAISLPIAPSLGSLRPSIVFQYAIIF